MVDIFKVIPIGIVCYILTIIKGKDYEIYKFNIPKGIGFLLNPLDPQQLPLSVLLMHMANLLSFSIGVAVYVFFDEFTFGKWYLVSLVALLLISSIVMRNIERDWF